MSGERSPSDHSHDTCTTCGEVKAGPSTELEDAPKFTAKARLAPDVFHRTSRRYCSALPLPQSQGHAPQDHGSAERKAIEPHVAVLEKRPTHCQKNRRDAYPSGSFALVKRAIVMPQSHFEACQREAPLPDTAITHCVRISTLTASRSPKHHARYLEGAQRDARAQALIYGRELCVFQRVGRDTSAPEKPLLTKTYTFMPYAGIDYQTYFNSIWSQQSGLYFEKQFAIDMLGLALEVLAVQAHQYVHSDITPDNVMINEGRIRLVDFEFRGRVGQSLNGGTRTRAPEDSFPHIATLSTDLWLLGRLFCRLSEHGPRGSSFTGLIYQLGQKLMSSKPSDRPTILEVIERLVEINQGIDHSKNWDQLPDLCQLYQKAVQRKLMHLDRFGSDAPCFTDLQTLTHNCLEQLHNGLREPKKLKSLLEQMTTQIQENVRAYEVQDRVHLKAFLKAQAKRLKAKTFGGRTTRLKLEALAEDGASTSGELYQRMKQISQEHKRGLPVFNETQLLTDTKSFLRYTLPFAHLHAEREETRSSSASAGAGSSVEARH